MITRAPRTNDNIARLADDIRSGRIASVMRQHAWEGGDYMFTLDLEP